MSFNLLMTLAVMSGHGGAAGDGAFLALALVGLSVAATAWLLARLRMPR